MVFFTGMSVKDKRAMDELVQMCGVVLSLLLMGVTLYNTARFFDRLEDNR